jgi:hypothetical protein
MVNPPAVLLNVRESMLQGTSMFGVKRTLPAMMRLAVPSFAGVPSGDQFWAVLQLLLAPPPFQVICACAGMIGKIKNIAVTSLRVRENIGIPFNVKCLSG